MTDFETSIPNILIILDLLEHSMLIDFEINPYSNLSDFECREWVDDFHNIFQITEFKVISVALSSIYLTFSNAFFILMILYEKVVKVIHQINS